MAIIATSAAPIEARPDEEASRMQAVRAAETRRAGGTPAPAAHDLVAGWPGLSAGAKLAWQALAREASGQQRRDLCVTFEWLAEALARSRSSAQRYLSELTLAGLLRRVARETRGFRYVLVDPATLAGPHLARGLDPQRELPFAAAAADTAVAAAGDTMGDSELEIAAIENTVAAAPSPPAALFCGPISGPISGPKNGPAAGIERAPPPAAEKKCGPQVLARPMVGEDPAAVLRQLMAAEEAAARDVRYRTLKDRRSSQDIDIAHRTLGASAGGGGLPPPDPVGAAPLAGAGPMAGAGPLAGAVALALEKLCDPARDERERRRLVAYIRQRCPDPRLQPGPCFRVATQIVAGRLDSEPLEGILDRARGNGAYLVGALQGWFAEEGLPWTRGRAARRSAG